MAVASIPPRNIRSYAFLAPLILHAVMLLHVVA